MRFLPWQRLLEKGRQVTDIAKLIEPKSDQQNYDDYITGPKTVTISEVRLPESDQQPMHLHLVEFPGRPYKPGLTMRRVLLGIWGKDGLAGWAGRKLTLHGDPDVMFGKQKVGGIRISHASHIDGPKTLMVTVTRGKKAPFTVQPMQSAPAPAPEGWQDDVAACESFEDLTEFYEMASAAGWWGPEIAAACTSRKAAIHDAGS